MKDNRIDNIVECAYNMDNGYVEVWFTDGNMLRIKCEEVEAALRTTEQSLAKLHRLLDNKPIEYVAMALSGEMQAYCDIEDDMVKGMDKCNMGKFVRDFIGRLTFANKEASDCAYEIIKYFDHNKIFYLSDFYKYVVGIRTNAAAHSVIEDTFLQEGKSPLSVEQYEADLKAAAEQQASQPSFKLAKEVKDYSMNDIGFGVDDDSDVTSTTVLTSASVKKSGPVIIRTRTGERIRIDKPIFCIGKSAQGLVVVSAAGAVQQ